MLGDRGELFGAVASMPTAWRLLERLDAANAPAVGSARPTARATAGAAGAATPAGVELRIDIDATITIAYSEKDAAPTWRRAFGYHPFLAFLDRPDIAGREALPGLLRAGNAGSNSARDYISVLDARPGPTTRRGPP